MGPDRVQDKGTSLYSAIFDQQHSGFGWELLCNRLRVLGRREFRAPDGLVLDNPGVSPLGWSAEAAQGEIPWLRSGVRLTLGGFLWSTKKKGHPAWGGPFGVRPWR